MTERSDVSTAASGTLYSLYSTHLKQRPDDVFIVGQDGALSYGEFHNKVLRASAWLEQHEIASGDMIAVWMVNHVEWLVLLFAAARRGAAVAAVNTRYRASEVTHILSKSGAKLLILEPHYKKIDFLSILKEIEPTQIPALEMIGVMGAVSDLGKALPVSKCVAFDLDQVAPADAQEQEMREQIGGDIDAPLILFTTSGTTKAPKLVCHTSRSITYHSFKAADQLGMGQAGTAILTALPLCGVFGLSGVLAAIKAGGRVVMLDVFEGSRGVRLMYDHEVTHIFGSDEMYRRLMEAADKATYGQTPFPKARIFGFGAFHPGARELIVELEKRGFPMVGVYGSSEVHALFSNWPVDADFETRVHGGGIPCAGNEAQVRIRDPETGELLGEEQSGEIEISTPGLFVGYYNDDAETKKAILPDGFFKTGDLGYLRADGGFVYETRMGDTMRLAGYLVNPSEIDDAVKEIPDIADVQTVGVQQDGRTIAVAFAILQNGAQITELEIQNQLKGQVAPFKIPAKIWFVDKFPVTQSANGEKIKRAELRKMALERLAGAEQIKI